MTKTQFLAALRHEIERLPESEIAKSLSYYEEIINDLVEEGLTEEEAVSRLGNVSDIAEQILSEAPLTALVRSKVQSKGNKRKLGWLAITLIVIGSPVWISIAAALLAVVIGIAAAVFAVVVAVFAAVAGLVLGGIGLILAAFFAVNLAGAAILPVAVGLICIGLGLLAYFVAAAMVKGIAKLMKKGFRSIKKQLIKKEAAY